MQSPDFEKTTKLFDLFKVPKEQRDENWKEEFFKALPGAIFRFGSAEQVEFGPDQLPYAKIHLPLPGEPFQPVMLNDLLQWITESGIGVVINEVNGQPEWVFPYGQMWSFREFGKFELPPEDNPMSHQTGKEVVESDREVMVGQPSEQYLPPYVRRVLKEFMKEGLQAKEEPKMLLMSEAEPRKGMSLVFSLFPEDFPNEEQYMAVLYMMRWFLPSNYAITGISKASPLVESLQPI